MLNVRRRTGLFTQSKDLNVDGSASLLTKIGLSHPGLQQFKGASSRLNDGRLALAAGCVYANAGAELPPLYPRLTPVAMEESGTGFLFHPKASVQFADDQLAAQRGTFQNVEAAEPIIDIFQSWQMIASWKEFHVGMGYAQSQQISPQQLRPLPPIDIESKCIPGCDRSELAFHRFEETQERLEHAYVCFERQVILEEGHNPLDAAVLFDRARLESSHDIQFTF